VQIALYVLGGLAFAAGLAGLVVPLLPGAPLLVAGVLLLAWAGHFTVIGWGTVIAAAVLGGLIAAVDFLAGLLGTRAFGASRWATVGAGVGVLVGLFFGLPGIVLGPALGALAFEYWKNPDMARAAKAGAGAVLGFLLGSVVKIALAFVLLGLVALAIAT
jgi:uncharacterized protein YqgC (DUF456 family)